MDFPVNIQEVPWSSAPQEQEDRQVGLRLFRAWAAPGTADSSAIEEAFAIPTGETDGKKALELAMALEIAPNLTVRYSKSIKFWGQTVLQSKVEIDVPSPIELDRTFHRSFEAHDEVFAVSGHEAGVDLAFEALLPVVRGISGEMIAFASTLLQAKERK